MQVWQFGKLPEDEYLCHSLWRATSRFHKEINILLSDTTTIKGIVKVIKYFIRVITPPKLSIT